MKRFLILSFAVVFFLPVSAHAEQESDVKTLIISSKGVHTETAERVASFDDTEKKKPSKKLSKALAEELARQTAANHAGKKKGDKIAFRMQDIAPAAGNENKYVPRSYHSQYYMPYSGHVSAPEAQTR